MHYTLFEDLKSIYAADPKKLDSLTREEFENIVSCRKEEKYGSYYGAICCSSTDGTLRV